jgi:SAM-dependent methyltransferase
VPENYFDERIASTYEARWPHLFESAVVDPAVDFLADLARSGTALELGIGTGRLALPLSRRGVRVHGIDLSPAMIAQLRAQPGADSIGVTIGDFATATVNQTFGLAYLVRNTITPPAACGPAALLAAVLSWRPSGVLACPSSDAALPVGSGWCMGALIEFFFILTAHHSLVNVFDI